MIKLFGKTENINKPLIGRASFTLVPKNIESDTIYVEPNPPFDNLMNYAGVITSRTVIDGKDNIHVPIIYNVDGIELINHGDVIEIYPNGQVNILFQIGANDNILFLTSKCNQSCLICPQTTEMENVNLMASNLRLVQLINDSDQEIALTGGEPTIIGDDLFKVILACKHYLPKTSLRLLTNGIKFFDYRYTQMFSSIKHPKMSVAVSLHNDNPFDHDLIVGREGAFNKTVTGIINLASFNNSIEIRTVINKYNCKRLINIADFIYRNMTFVNHIAFMGLETIGNALSNINSLWVEPEDIHKPLEDTIHYLVQRNMNVSIYNIPMCLLPQKLWRYARQSISGWKNKFHEKCNLCDMRKDCSGLFESGIRFYGNYLMPFSH